MSTREAETDCDAHAWRYAGRAGRDVRDPKCWRKIRLACAACGLSVLQRCRAASAEKCAPCAETYRHSVRRIAQSGLLRCVEGGSIAMLTFTAPGDNAHNKRDGVRCECTPEGGVDLEEWNGRAVDRWNDLQRAIEREWGAFAYFKAVEVQNRGALHLHVLVRFRHRVVISVPRLRQLAMRHGYGHSVDVRANINLAAAGYVAKYVSKSAAGRVHVPYRHRQTGRTGGRWRTWTASRNWGATMRAIRQAQAEWAASAARGEAAAELAPGAEGALLIKEVSITQRQATPLVWPAGVSL